MRISIIGCGYLGAVHAASMAELGHEVIGIDVDPARIKSLGQGIAPFHEPGFDALLKKNASRLTFTTEMSAAKGASVHFVAVGTPQSADGSADVTHVNDVIDGLLPFLSRGDLVVGKSTVPVGTAERLSAEVTPTGAMVMWNPEFLREGFAVEDTLSPDRLVYGVPLGTNGETATAILDRVYAEILAKDTPRLVMNFSTAELVKVASNAFLATKISFINAMAQIADVTGADVTQLADAIGYDNRIGRRFLNAGIGFGGGCLPKDIRAFVARAEELEVGEALSFLKAVDEINLRMRERVVDMLMEELDTFAGKTIAVWGISFKPDSDDIRDSPALDIAQSLARAGATVVCADPQGWKPAQAQLARAGLLASLTTTSDHRKAVQGASALLVATDWEVFQNEDPDIIADLMTKRIVIDGRNCLNSDSWKAAGFQYRGMGRN